MSQTVPQIKVQYYNSKDLESTIQKLHQENPDNHILRWSLNKENTYEGGYTNKKYILIRPDSSCCYIPRKLLIKLMKVTFLIAEGANLNIASLDSKDDDYPPESKEDYYKLIFTPPADDGYNSCSENGEYLNSGKRVPTPLPVESSMIDW